MSRSNAKNSLHNKFRDFSTNSLFLLQRKDLVDKSLLLNSDFDYRWSFSYESPRSKKCEYSSSQNWITKNTLKAFKIQDFSDIWEKIWDKEFVYPTSYFFSHNFSNPRYKLKYSDFSQNLVNFGLAKDNLYKKAQFNWANEYVEIIDTNEIQEEILRQQKKVEEDNLTSELLKLDLIRKYEALNAKFSSTSEKPLEIEVEKKEKISKTIEWKPDVLKVSSQESQLTLKNSLPSMFLSHFRSKDFVINSAEPLKDVPKWIKKINAPFKRWSIAQYIPEERAKVLFGPVNFDSLSKDNIQWQDPEEKWFYCDLPLINLFFDRYREKYKKTLITTWEEPEYTFPITDIDISDSFDFSKAKSKPVFSYEGIPSIEIGRDLELIQSIIDLYGSHYEEQSKKELAEEGLAPVTLSESLNATDLLNKLEKEKESV